LLLLTFETSAKAASVALFEGEKLLGESYQNTGLTHSQTLMVMAQDLIKQCGYTPADITHTAVAAGPGSFTGVRIGVAAAKGFAWGKEIPCYGVSTLEAMALGLGIWDGTVVCAMDARRSQVYNAVFQVERGVLTRISEDRAIALADLKTELERIDGPVYLVGDGAALTHRTLTELPLILPPEWKQHQRAVGVGLAALAAIARGEAGDAAALAPNYLRLSQAERERLEKENK
jgi:tRNA threonylcarbamoyladenosine biosynthesis protein TsaB